jgi:hypothetical protein
MIWASPTAAQEGEQPADQEAVTDQDEQQDEAEGERTELKRVLLLQKLMRKEIKLRDEQLRPVNELFEQHLEALREQQQAEQEGQEDNSARIKEVQQQIADAKRAGDLESVREAVRELHRLQGGRAQMQALHRRFRDAVLEELDEEQGAKFRNLYRKVLQRRDSRSAVRTEFQAIRQGLRSLELSVAQQEAVQEHFRELRTVLAKFREGDTSGAEEALAQVRQRIVGELTEEQAAEFEKAVAKARTQLGRRLDRPQRPRRGTPRRQPGSEADRQAEDEAESEAEERDREYQDADPPDEGP